MAGRKSESDGIEETRGARLPPGMGGWGRRGLKRRGGCRGGLEGYERKGQAHPGALRLWWWWWGQRHHPVEIRPRVAADGRVPDRCVHCCVLLLGGAKIHRGDVDKIFLGTSTLVICRGASPAHRVAEALVVLVIGADPYFKRRRCRVGGFGNRHRTLQEEGRVGHGALQCRVHRGGIGGAHDDASLV